MTGEDLVDSMEYVAAYLVEGAEDPTPVKKTRWKSVAAIAACLAVLIGIGIVIHKQHSGFVLTAEQVAEVFDFEEENTLGDEGFNPKVIVEAGEIPKLNPLPTGETMPIFHRNNNKIFSTTDQLQSWSAPIMQRLQDKLPDTFDGMDDYDIVTSGSYWGDYYYFCMERTRKDAGKLQLWLEGELVAIDPSQSDEEIIASMETIKQKLFEIFEADFPDVKLVRRGEEYVSITYYDESAHLLALGDHITISFNCLDYQGSYSSADERITAKIRYYHYLLPLDEIYQTLADGKLISLEKAEKMLAKGYAFGRKCQACMAEQTGEGCSHYDYVSFEYVEDNNKKGLNLAIPCYVFYIKTQELNDGSTQYSKTYVCAVEVWGLEDYFKSQKE